MTIIKTVLVFIDGTICDTQHRHHLWGTPEFGSDEEILKDEPVPGSVECILELSGKYSIVYMGARPEAQRAIALKSATAGTTTNCIWKSAV